MFRALALLPMALFLFASPGSAQCNDDRDQICIIFDHPDGCCQNCFVPTPGEPFDAYVVLQNPSETSGVSGMPFCLCREGGASFEPPADTIWCGLAYPPGTVVPCDHSEGTCFACGFAWPLPPDECLLLLSVCLITYGNEEWCFGVQPMLWFYDQMLYSAGEDQSRLIVMEPCTGPAQDSCAMACINSAECVPIASGPTTWGSVKAMFR